MFTGLHFNGREHTYSSRHHYWQAFYFLHNLYNIFRNKWKCTKTCNQNILTWIPETIKMTRAVIRQPSLVFGCTPSDDFYPLKGFCLLIMQTPQMLSDSAPVFIIVTKKQGIACSFWKHRSHHSLAHSCHVGTVCYFYHSFITNYHWWF